MNRILIINPILYTKETKERKFESIKDCLLITVCRGFKKIGYDVTLICDKNYKPLNEENYDFDILYFDNIFKKIFGCDKIPFPKGLLKYLRNERDNFDFIITSEIFSIYSLFALLKCKNKLIVWQELAIHNSMMKGFASKFWYNIIGKICFKNTIIAPRSKRAKIFISKYCKNVDGDIYQHPIDLKKFSFCYEKDNYFISVSQLVERKQVDRIIDNFYAFSKKYPDFKLYICGDGPEKNKLERLARDLNMNDKIIFTGNIDHNKLYSLMARAKALLIYTKKDNSILTISESVASGTPVITTPIPDNADFVIDKKVGIVNENWGIEEMKVIVENNKSFVERCKNCGEELSNNYIANKFVELYKNRGEKK